MKWQAKKGVNVDAFKNIKQDKLDNQLKEFMKEKTAAENVEEQKAGEATDAKPEIVEK